MTEYFACVVLPTCLLSERIQLMRLALFTGTGMTVGVPFRSAFTSESLRQSITTTLFRRLEGAVKNCHKYSASRYKGRNILSESSLITTDPQMTTKVALVTGAARGIGRAIALRLAEDGLDVAVNDLPNTPELDDVVREIESKGRRSLAVPADVSLEKGVEKMIQQVVDKLGSLDVVSLSPCLTT